MGAEKKEFAAGNFYRFFTAVSYDFPLEGDAKKAFAVLAQKNSEALRSDIKTENKTTVRRILKTWEAGIDPDLTDGDFLYELRYYSLFVTRTKFIRLS